MKENVHTVKMLDIIISDCMNNIFIVMNYVENDLSHMLRSNHAGLNEDTTLVVLFKMLCAVRFIHKANIIHRDIKPGNFLIDRNNDVFLCDFGLARTLPKVESKKVDYSRETMTRKLIETQAARKKGKRQLSNHVVTRFYRAPEIILQEKKYHTTADLWSVGCIFSELIES